MHFIMNVGLPASGKTYCAHRLVNYKTFSSDEIRNELFPAGDGYTKQSQIVVFDTLGKRVKQSLADGRDVIYDATNLNRKMRMKFLREIADYDCFKSCYLFVEPIEVLKIRNMFREESVPDYVYDRMLRRFQVPIMREGWDEIKLFTHYNSQIKNEEAFLSELEQNNKYHTLTIGGHNKRAVSILRENPEFQKLNSDEKVLVAEATKQHDIGKAVTVSKTNNRNERDGNYHYYGHNYAGAYLALSNRRNLDSFKMATLDLALLIELHMKPFQWAKNPELKNKDIERYGDWAIKAVEMIHEADVKAR